VLVEVQAAAVTPGELAWDETWAVSGRGRSHAHPGSGGLSARTSLPCRIGRTAAGGPHRLAGALGVFVPFFFVSTGIDVLLVYLAIPDDDVGNGAIAWFFVRHTKSVVRPLLTCR
jgi:hypothetical protein